MLSHAGVMARVQTFTNVQCDNDARVFIAACLDTQAAAKMELLEPEPKQESLAVAQCHLSGRPSAR